MYKGYEDKGRGKHMAGEKHRLRDRDQERDIHAQRHTDGHKERCTERKRHA